ncbi:MAG: indole-3-glycerol phosphate synthase TrpC [Deltaproteobacteria bacterium]|nr:indole-3-glycerol phosphate synthase TrpC [Deltaproteobacteria bacterium]
MHKVLKKIIDYKKLEVEHIARQEGRRDMQKRAADAPPCRDFWNAISQYDFNVIAELKHKSPSAGILVENYQPEEIAKGYQDAGAAALSVLTDEHFFGGKREHLNKVKESVELPLLRKDFVLDEFQIFEAKSYGADAILLIVNVLDSFQIADYQALANELGLFSLVETHNPEDWQAVSNLKLDVVGVNNRNLDTLVTDVQTVFKMREVVDGAVQIIAESGLRNDDNLKKLKEIGIVRYLIGEAFLETRDPGQALDELLKRARD